MKKKKILNKNRKKGEIADILITILVTIMLLTSIIYAIINPSLYAIICSLFITSSVIGFAAVDRSVKKAEKKYEKMRIKKQMENEFLKKELEKKLRIKEKLVMKDRKISLNELMEPVELIDLKNTLIAFNELYENQGSFKNKMHLDEMDESVIEDYEFTISNLLDSDAKIIFTKDAIIDLVCKLRKMEVKEISPAFIFYDDEFYIYKHINKEFNILTPIKDEIMYKIFDSNKKNYNKKILYTLFAEKFGDLDDKNFQK